MAKLALSGIQYQASVQGALNNSSSNNNIYEPNKTYFDYTNSNVAAYHLQKIKEETTDPEHPQDRLKLFFWVANTGGHVPNEDLKQAKLCITAGYFGPTADIKKLRQLNPGNPNFKEGTAAQRMTGKEAKCILNYLLFGSPLNVPN